MVREVPVYLLVAICLLPTVLMYPVFGTKRYGRSSQYAPTPVWNSAAPVHVAYQQPPTKNQRFHPVNYYDMYPYGHGYGDDYYYPQHEALNYPVYYAPARTSKYEVYQAVLPYYYEDRRTPTRPYGYYGYEEDADPVENVQDEIMQEQEREEREDALPVGQETWFENDNVKNTNGNDDEENLDDVNAAFLQNLILSQMYNNAMDDRKAYPVTSVYGDDRLYVEDGSYNWMDASGTGGYQKYKEDEDVRELKQLAKPIEKDHPFKDQKQERLHMFRKGGSKKEVRAGPNDGQKWNKWENKRTVENNRVDDGRPVVYGKAKIGPDNRKQRAKYSATTVAPTSNKPSSSKTPARDTRGGGQKEVMLMRPATPIRHPFSEPVMEMLAERNNNNKDKKRVPSVYDTIKHMLEMEKNLEMEKQGGDHDGDIRSPMKKRFVTNEEALVKELSGLKNTVTA